MADIHVEGHIPGGPFRLNYFTRTSSSDHSPHVGLVLVRVHSPAAHTECARPGKPTVTAHDHLPGRLLPCRMASPRRVSPRGSAPAVVRVAALALVLLGPAHGQSLSGMASSSVLAARAISSTLAVVVDEYDTTDVLQRAPIQSTTIPNCFVTTPNGYSSYGANSANGAYAMFTCGTATNPSNGEHPIIRIDAGGNIDTTAYYAGDTYFLPRGVASMDGSNIFTGDGEHHGCRRVSA